MAIQTPLKATFDANNNPTGLAEFRDSVDTISSEIGGTGLVNPIGLLYGDGTGQTLKTKYAPAGDIVGTDDAQTLSNKIFASPTLNGEIEGNAIVTTTSTLNPSQTKVMSQLAIHNFVAQEITNVNQREIPENVSQLNNDVGFITTNDIPVTSVNGQTGAVTIDTQNLGFANATTNLIAGDYLTGGCTIETDRTFNVDVGPGADQVVINSALGSAAYINTGTQQAQIPTNADIDSRLGTAAFTNLGTNAGELVPFDNFGTAAFVDTGTGGGQVPTNADLGSVAYLNTGQAAGEVPTNADLGTASLRNVGLQNSNLVLYEDFGQAAFANLGTGPGEIPTIDDFGTAATLDIGSAGGQIPTNGILGNAAYANTGTALGNVIIIDQVNGNGVGKLPILDGSNLINVSGGGGGGGGAATVPGVATTLPTGDLGTVAYDFPKIGLEYGTVLKYDLANDPIAGTVSFDLGTV